MEDKTTPKLCDCGCGQPAPIATRTNYKFGHVQGKPMRYRLGHSHRGPGPTPDALLCACGCGGRTVVTIGRYQKRYIHGHNSTVRRISETDYRVEDCGYMTPCWVWAHKIYARHGYGKVTIDGRKQNAHRAFWLQERGAVPEGLELDHLCHNKACIRLEHLEPVTHRENMRRSRARRDSLRSRKASDIRRPNRALP